RTRQGERLLPIASLGRVLETLPGRLADSGVDGLTLIGRSAGRRRAPCGCSRLRLHRWGQSYRRADLRSLFEWARLLLASRRGPLVILFDPLERLGGLRQGGDWRRGRRKGGLFDGRRGGHRRKVDDHWPGTPRWRCRVSP